MVKPKDGYEGLGREGRIDEGEVELDAEEAEAWRGCAG
jgi:hypothetical protein